MDDVKESIDESRLEVNKNSVIIRAVRLFV